MTEVVFEVRSMVILDKKLSALFTGLSMFISNEISSLGGNPLLLKYIVPQGKLTTESFEDAFILKSLSSNVPLNS